jgi:hypothetical protein
MWRNGALERHHDTRTHDAEMGRCVQRAQRETEQSCKYPNIRDRGASFAEPARCNTPQNQRLGSAKRAHKPDSKSNMHRSARV